MIFKGVLFEIPTNKIISSLLLLWWAHFNRNLGRILLKHPSNSTHLQQLTLITQGCRRANNTLCKTLHYSWALAFMWRFMTDWTETCFLNIFKYSLTLIAKVEQVDMTSHRLCIYIEAVSDPGLWYYQAVWKIWVLSNGCQTVKNDRECFLAEAFRLIHNNTF